MSTFSRHEGKVYDGEEEGMDSLREEGSLAEDTHKESRRLVEIRFVVGKGLGGDMHHTSSSHCLEELRA